MRGSSGVSSIMAFGGVVSGSGLGAILIVIGCHAPSTLNPVGPIGPVSQEPQWLLVRVESVNVAPFHPGTQSLWDGPAPEPGDGAECGLLGLAFGLINPIVGKGAQYLCQMDSRPKQLETGTPRWAWLLPRAQASSPRRADRSCWGSTIPNRATTWAT